MIVHDFDLCRALWRPNKAHAELVVYSDRMLPLTITRQRFETIARRRPQVAETACRIEVTQLPARRLNEIGRKAFRRLAVEHGLGGLVPKALDHESLVS